MIVERIPSFLSSHKNYSNPDDIEFDKNGRFIYIKRDVVKSNPHFLIYDILFNSFIELTADDSISDLKIRSTLAINNNQFFILHEISDLSRLLILISFDLKAKKYGVLDQVQIDKCQDIRLMRDDDTFGLFFMTSQDGEWVNDVDNENSKFALLTFQIQENRIVLNATTKKFNYLPYNDDSNPLDLYLRRDKLWFIRRKDGHIEWFSLRPKPARPPNPAKDDLLISYFDLNEECPAEIQADEIKLCRLGLPDISSVSWVKDVMIIQLTETKFDLFDLNKCAWSSETIDYSGQFYYGTLAASTKVDEEWVYFHRYNDVHTTWISLSTINVNNHFVISAINKKSGSLHLIPLRNPHKLLDICWISALNAGLLESSEKLPKLPYSRLF